MQAVLNHLCGGHIPGWGRFATIRHGIQDSDGEVDGDLRSGGVRLLNHTTAGDGHVDVVAHQPEAPFAHPQLFLAQFFVSLELSRSRFG